MKVQVCSVFLLIYTTDVFHPRIDCSQTWCVFQSNISLPATVTTIIIYLSSFPTPPSTSPSPSSPEPPLGRFPDSLFLPRLRPTIIPITPFVLYIPLFSSTFPTPVILVEILFLLRQVTYESKAIGALWIV